jgi:peptidoglycan hydrolase CwlO-like protein
MTNSQIYIFILTTFSSLTIAIIGFWLKNFITRIQSDFETMLRKYETLTGSVSIISTELEKLSGKVEYMEKRIEKHSDAILKFNHDIAVLTERLSNTQKNIEKS